MPSAISRARRTAPKPFLRHRGGWRNLLRRWRYALRLLVQRGSVQH